MTARGTGRFVGPRPEDADATVQAPFTDPATWERWMHHRVSMPVKVALEAHGVLVKWLGHAGTRSCPCPLARAACTAWDGGA